MSLNEFWRRLTKRPLAAALVVILAALAGYVGWTTASGQAESQTAVVVVPPWSLEDENFKNPMLNLGDRATALASALVVAIHRSEVEGSVVQAGATSYEASNMATDVRDPTRSAVIFLTVMGPDEKTANAGSQALIDRTRTVLKEMQEQSGTGDAPYMATLQVISQPQETTTFASRQMRSAAALSASVLVAGLIIFWAIETMIDRRSRAREHRNHSVAADLGLDRNNDDPQDELNGHSYDAERSFQQPASVGVSPRYSDNA